MPYPRRLKRRFRFVFSFLSFIDPIQKKKEFTKTKNRKENKSKSESNEKKVNGNNKCYKHYENYYDYEKTLINTSKRFRNMGLYVCMI